MKKDLPGPQNRNRDIVAGPRDQVAAHTGLYMYFRILYFEFLYLCICEFLYLCIVVPKTAAEILLRDQGGPGSTYGSLRHIGSLR